VEVVLCSNSIQQVFALGPEIESKSRKFCIHFLHFDKPFASPWANGQHERKEHVTIFFYDFAVSFLRLSLLTHNFYFSGISAHCAFRLSLKDDATLFEIPVVALRNFALAV
jgi:hypothetical protein